MRSSSHRTLGDRRCSSRSLRLDYVIARSRLAIPLEVPVERTSRDTFSQVRRDCLSQIDTYSYESDRGMYGGLAE